MYTFDAKKTAEELVAWVRDYFDKQGPNTKVIIGESGGKDSSTVTALCVKALGKERVIGVLMPQGEQHDIDYSYDLCEFFGIEHVVVNIGEMVKPIMKEVAEGLQTLGHDTLSTVTTFNTPARVRMIVLYGISGTVGGRVANTCNLSEDWVGYATKYGDGAGDFSPLMHLTVQEVKAVGRELGLPEKFIEKTPIDGLCGKSDEENLGFTYQTLDRYIREGICEDAATKAKIDDLHAKNLHKLMPMHHYNPNLQVVPKTERK